jgi:hypothetical protein
MMAVAAEMAVAITAKRTTEDNNSNLKSLNYSFLFFIDNNCEFEIEFNCFMRNENIIYDLSKHANLNHIYIKTIFLN